MPKRTDLESILIIGAGPIIIGQACEFDYSGVQACRALREEGYRVVLVNSNPATIMTDPEFADATYIEPLHWRTIAQIIKNERPDALLPTMGGQTALNCSLDLCRHEVLEEYWVEMIGASQKAIDTAEDREKFKEAMKAINLEVPRSALAHNMEEAFQALDYIGLPCVIRASFTLGGTGSGVAYNREEFADLCQRGLDASPTSELMLDESLLGWKEYEMEVVRDSRDNCIIVCSIENIDPMGVHTGDSITVAPALTLTDREYQCMRDASIAILRKIGVDTGGSNVQFAVDPETGRQVVIEMNPRVSRSSALASKATGFPIAKVAAKLAVGITLDELRNEVTGDAIPASFEPALSYVVTKIPRFDFEKFPTVDDILNTQMKSVGEVMGIGHSFQESLQKAICSLENGLSGLDSQIDLTQADAKEQVCAALRKPTPQRFWYVADAFRLGMGVTEIYDLCKIDRWFLTQVADLVAQEAEVLALNAKPAIMSPPALPPADHLWQLKRSGFSDIRLAKLCGVDEKNIRGARHKHEVIPSFKRVDACAGEFPATTAYLYSTYEQECEANVTDKEKYIVLGGGPNRIGQGIEFDYCCVHAVLALREAGKEAIMVNCNPETVSTDHDMSDRLYFEPITFERVMDIVALEKPAGVILQFGGQTPLRLASALEEAGMNILGTASDAIDRAEDRARFQKVIKELGLQQPPNRTATTSQEALKIADDIGFPMVLRPSYVLGGRAMEIIFNETELQQFIDKAMRFSYQAPLLLDRFLEDAIEVDVDAVCDGKEVMIGAIMQHIEQAGVHSGDSACSFPPYYLDIQQQQRISEQVKKLALKLNVLGLVNAQMAVQNGDIFVLEVNPRASRTVPFVSKSTGVALAKIATRCMLGMSLKDQQVKDVSISGIPNANNSFYCVKEAVFPFNRFPGADPVLGPEMKSTGEAMGIGATFGEAFGKSQLAAGIEVPEKGVIFLSVRDGDKQNLVSVAQQFTQLGYSLVATRGTAEGLRKNGLQVETVNKVLEGRPHIVDRIKDGKVQMVVNTCDSRQAIKDSASIRSSALQYGVYCLTTLAAANALCDSLQQDHTTAVYKLQELHSSIR